MQVANRSRSDLRSAGPFVTQSGHRLPVRVLSTRDVPSLVEFYDYLSRRSKKLRLVGEEDATRARVEALRDGVDLDSKPIIAIMSGPAALIRGIGQYRSASVDTAQVQFTIDDSLREYEVEAELLHRVAEHARGRGFHFLSVVAPPDSALLEAIDTAFTIESECDSGETLVSISGDGDQAR